MDYTTDAMETLQLRNEALQTKIEALMMKIEALEMKNQFMLETNDILQSFGSKMPTMPGQKAPKRVETQKVTKMKEPLSAAVEKLLKDGSYNRATSRAITGVLLCLW